MTGGGAIWGEDCAGADEVGADGYMAAYRLPL